MHPDLFNLRFFGREIGIHSYGLLVAMGFVAGIWVATRQARRRGLEVAR